MNDRILNPRSYHSRAIRGESRSSDLRMKRFQAARLLRQELRPQRTQQEVASVIGVSRAAIEWLELSALTKIINAFKRYA
jgi:predicted DNA-binding protein (UPF0251 family)